MIYQLIETHRDSCLILSERSNQNPQINPFSGDSPSLLGILGVMMTNAPIEFDVSMTQDFGYYM
jgi:hypothetical protein